MKDSTRSIFLAALLGALGGAVATYIAVRAREQVVIPSSTAVLSLSDDPFAETPNNEAGSAVLDDHPFSGSEWTDRLLRLSGAWISADGQQAAELDYRTLSFGATKNWPDIENQTYLLGQEMQFLSKDGFYSVCVDEAPDSLRIIKQDLATDAYCGFTLYREGSPQARSREPLGDITPPPVIRGILDQIPNIREGERKDAVMGRIDLGPGKIEVLECFSSLGVTDMLISLGIDRHWMLKLDYKLDPPDSPESEATILRFQIIRGEIDDARNGSHDIEQIIYPYFHFGKIITASAIAKQPDARPKSKSEGSQSPQPELEERPR